MRLDDLTPGAFTVLFKELALAYRANIPAGDLDATVDVYYKTLRIFAAPIVEQACSDFRTHPARGFPRAPEMAARCRELEAKGQREIARQHQDDVGSGDICPHCRRAFGVAGYELGNGTVVGRRRCACPPGGSGWFTPAARAWRESTIPTVDGLRELLGRGPRPPADRSPSELAEIKTLFKAPPAALELPIDAGDAWEQPAETKREPTARV